MRKSLIRVSVLCLSVFGRDVLGHAQSPGPTQEQIDIDKWETHREETKIPARLFPDATKILLYTSKEGFAFTDKGEPILATKPSELSPSEAIALRGSVFYGEPPPILLGCAPRLHYVFQFFDPHGKQLGSLWFWIDGYHEILPASPPSPDVQSVIVEPSVEKIIQSHLGQIQLAALNRLPCGA